MERDVPFTWIEVDHNESQVVEGQTTLLGSKHHGLQLCASGMGVMDACQR